MVRRSAVAAVAFAASLLAAVLEPSPASAFCRTTTCTTGARCMPANPGDCGVPIQWKQLCIGFAIQQDASWQVTYHDADVVLRAAFSSWMKVDCGGMPPSIEVQDLGSAKCGQVEYNENAGNVNVLVFRDKDWPHKTDPGSVEAIALTTVTFDVTTGEIYDADIEVNTAQNTITVTDTGIQTDLQSVLTHEAGHFLGLAHTQSSSATMYFEYNQGSDGIRNLSQDDIEAICNAYAPSRSVQPDCDPIPRHGFATECSVDQKEGKCAVSPGPSRPGGPAAFGFAAAVALLGLRRRRSGS